MRQDIKPGVFVVVAMVVLLGLFIAVVPDFCLFSDVFSCWCCEEAYFWAGAFIVVFVVSMLFLSVCGRGDD